MQVNLLWHFVMQSIKCLKCVVLWQGLSKTRKSDRIIRRMIIMAMFLNSHCNGLLWIISKTMNIWKQLTISRILSHLSVRFPFHFSNPLGIPFFTSSCIDSANPIKQLIKNIKRTQILFEKKWHKILLSL